MSAAFYELHWLAVIAGTIASTILGGIFFMVLVPKQYLYVTGRESLPADQQKVTGAIFVIGPMVCSLVTVIANAYLVAWLGIQYGLLNAPYFVAANLIACILLVVIPL